MNGIAHQGAEMRGDGFQLQGGGEQGQAAAQIVVKGAARHVLEDEFRQRRGFGRPHG